MITMLGIEVRRCLARRLVRWLILLALLGCGLAGVIGWREAGPAGTADELRLVELWGGDDPILGIAAFFLPAGAVVAGASMIGAEWRAGTFVMLMTWQPHRRRVATAKLLACGVVAAAVAIGLLVLFGAAFLPATLWGRGTTAGVDAAWFASLSGGMLRIAATTALAAMLMAAIAMIGRNTAAALGVAFGYLMLVENIVRAWKPWAGRFLLGENGAVFVTGADLETAAFTRSTLTAGLTLTGYVAMAAVISVALFQRRDIAAT
ncbi:MAG: ABC transporter permease [Acidimicrobiales bacterium]